MKADRIKLVVRAISYPLKSIMDVCKQNWVWYRQIDL